MYEAFKKKELWIDLVEVAPQPGNDVLGSDKRGASVNVIALASSQDDFKRQICASLTKLGLNLVEFENPGPFSKRISEHQIAPDLTELAKNVKRDGILGFGTFHTFPLKQKPK